MTLIVTPIFIPMGEGDMSGEVFLYALLITYLLFVPIFYIVHQYPLRGRDILFGIFVQPFILPFKLIKWFFRNF